MRLENHPTVRRLEASHREGARDANLATIGAEELHQLALDCGAADAGIFIDNACQAQISRDVTVEA